MPLCTMGGACEVLVGYDPLALLLFPKWRISPLGNMLRLPEVVLTEPEVAL